MLIGSQRSATIIMRPRRRDTIPFVLPFLAIVLSTNLLFLKPSQSGELFAVALPRFSTFVTEDGNYTPLNPIVDGSRVPRSVFDRGRVYFSFTVIGGDDALKHLLEAGNFPVRVTLWVDDVRAETIDIGMTPEHWERDRAAFSELHKNNGLFHWRTKMYTQKNFAKKIEITIRDAFDAPVKPIGQNTIFRPTIYIDP
jgi:hypothetical protein